MNKVTLVAAIAAAAGAAHGQAFFEDFEGGLPAGWSVADDAGQGVIWMTNAQWGDGNYTNGSGLCMMIDTDEGSNGLETDSSVVTSTFTVPSNAMLDLTANFQQLGTDFFDIDINTGNGWANLLSWGSAQGDHGGFYSTPGEDISLSLAAYAGATAQLRFRNADTASTNDWNWYAQIDNVGVTPAPGAMALLGLGGLAATRRRR